MQYSTLRGRGPVLAAGVLFAAGAIGAVVSLTTAGIRRRMRVRLTPVGSGVSQSNIKMESRFRSLRRLLLGCDMKQVTRHLGQPRTASVGSSASGNAVWYYPVDAQRQIALAVTFDRGLAERIECLRGLEAGA